MAWATVKAFDAAHAPPGATLEGGGYRTTGRVEALARCASTHLHDSTVRRTALRGRPARRPARRDAGRITSAGQRRRRPRVAALRVAFRAPDCRGNRKRDPTCRGIVQGSTGIAARVLFLACRPISAVPHPSMVRSPGQHRNRLRSGVPTCIESRFQFSVRCEYLLTGVVGGFGVYQTPPLAPAETAAR